MTNASDTSLNPEEFTEEVAAALPQSSRSERSRLLEQARAWANTSYPEEVPHELNVRLTELEEQWHSQMK